VILAGDRGQNARGDEPVTTRLLSQFRYGRDMNVAYGARLPKSNARKYFTATNNSCNMR
jgi:hypothetical protein